MNLARIEVIKDRSTSLLSLKSQAESAETELAYHREQANKFDAKRNKLWREFYETYREFAADCGTCVVDSLIESHAEKSREIEALHKERCSRTGQNAS